MIFYNIIISLLKRWGEYCLKQLQFQKKLCNYDHACRIKRQLIIDWLYLVLNKQIRVLCILSSVQGLCFTSVVPLLFHLMFLCCTSFVPLLFLSCAPVLPLQYLLYLSCSFQVPLLFLCLSPEDIGKISRCPIEAHSCPSFVSFSLIKYHLFGRTALSYLNFLKKGLLSS